MRELAANLVNWQRLAASSSAMFSGRARGKIMKTAGGSSQPAGNPSQQAGNPKGKGPLFPAWAWVAAVGLALITGYSVRQMQQDTSRLNTLRQQVKIAELQNRELQEHLALGQMVTSMMMSPESVPLSLVPKNKAMPIVHAYLHPTMGVALTAETMPQVPPASTLQLWCLPKKGVPVSLGVFKPDAKGGVQMVAPLHMPMSEVTALEISEEPAGGSPQPTQSPAWVAQLK